mgnify:FL=1
MLSRFLQPSQGIYFSLILLQQALFITGGLAGSRPEIYQLLSFKKIVEGLFWGLGLFFLNTGLGALVLTASTRLLGSELTELLIARERAGVEVFLGSSNPVFVQGIMLLLIMGAPLSEELFFRGLLLDFWKERLGAVKSTFLAALIFALLHFYLIQFIPVLAAGILLGFMFIRTENIFTPIIAHGVANTLVLLILLANL